MKTHMMGVGMAFVEMVLMSGAVSITGRGVRHGGARAGRGDGSFTLAMADGQSGVLEEQLAALIPQEPGSPRARGQADAEQALREMDNHEAVAGETAMDRTGIFSFRETAGGSFELWELAGDSEVDVDWSEEDLSLMERIREL